MTKRIISIILLAALFAALIPCASAEGAFLRESGDTRGINNSFSSAISASLGQTYTGRLMRIDPCDYYKFYNDLEGSFPFLITSQISVRVDLYDADEKLIWGCDLNPGDFSSPVGSVFFKFHLAVGTYYFRISCIGSASAGYVTGSYSLKLGERLATPVIALENVEKTGKVKVTWEAIEGASRYEVCRSTSQTGEYVTLKITEKLSFTNTSGEAGVKYYYKVRALSDPVTNIASDFCSPKYRTCDLPQPSVRGTHVPETGKNKLEWDRIDGAVGYEIYRSEVKDGEYSLIKTVTKTSFVNTAGVAGVTYYYRVRALAKNSSADSALSEIKTLTCDLPCPVVAAELDDTGRPSLSWEAVEGAVAYNVYRATSAGGSYTLMKTTANLTYKNTNFSPGTTYYYKVMALAERESANSAYSAVVSVTT